MLPLHDVWKYEWVFVAGPPVNSMFFFFVVEEHRDTNGAQITHGSLRKMRNASRVLESI